MLSTANWRRWIIKGYSTHGVHYRDLQAQVHEQEIRH